jgi:hypothetical protein
MGLVFSWRTRIRRGARLMSFPAGGAKRSSGSFAPASGVAVRRSDAAATGADDGAKSPRSFGACRRDGALA